MPFLSRFLAVVMLFTSITQAMLIPAQQPPQLASSGAAVSQSKREAHMPLDFTPLPRDVQKIVLGYIGAAGWAKSELCAIPDSELVGTYQIRAYGFLIGHTYRACSAGGVVAFEKENPEADNIVESIDPKPDGNYMAANILTMCFSWDERYFALSGENDSKYSFTDYGKKNAYTFTKIYQLATGTCVMSIPEEFTALALSPDNNFLLGGFKNSFIALYNIKTGKKIVINEDKSYVRDFGYVRDLFFSTDGSFFVVRDDSKKVTKWEYQPDLNDLK